MPPPRSTPSAAHEACLPSNGRCRRASPDSARVGPPASYLPSYDSQFDFDDDIPAGGEDFSKPQQFFDLYGPVFKRNARFSERRPVPQLGDVKTNMDDVLDFYNFWYGRSARGEV